MASLNLIGWGEFKISGVTICKGKVEIQRQVNTVENRVNHGTSTVLDDITVTGINEEFKIEVREFGEAIIKLWYGFPQATSISSAQVVPTDYPTYTSCTLDVFHRKNSGTPFLTRAGFNCKAIPDGTLAIDREQYTGASLRIMVLDVVGTLRNQQLA